MIKTKGRLRNTLKDRIRVAKPLVSHYAATMSIVELLLETARADTDLLIKNDELGDNFNVPREVDFLLLAPTAEKADIAACFINDNRYGEAKVESDGESHRIHVSIVMPTTQHVLCAVSGLMACISKVFDLEYDGWEADIRRLSR